MKKKGAKKKAKEDALLDELLKRAEPKIDKIAGELTEQLEAKFATLKILLEDHPDKRVSLLLNSISDDLGKACTTALKDVETIKEERTIAHAATSEISNLRDHISQTGREPLTLTSEIDRMQNQLNLMEGGGGGGVERLVYLVFHTIIVRGWKKFHLDVWTQGSQLFSDEYLVSCIQLLGRVRGGVEGGVLEWLLPTVDLLCFVNRKKI